MMCKNAAIAILVSSVLGGSIAFAKDHPLIQPYPGSSGGVESVREFDTYELPLGPLAAQDGGFTKAETLEGRVTVINYASPAGRSALEIYRNYEQGLTKAGFETLFACKSHQCADKQRNMTGTHRDLGKFMTVYEDMYYLAARLRRAEGDVYAAVNMSGRDFVRINLVEVKPMETGKVTVDAAALAGDILREGHVAVYGIYFDTGKSEIKPGSDPVLTEIAKLLREKPALKLHVVGHTDNVGALAMNMDLSRRRAGAVVQELVAKHGIPAARLHPDGVGPLAPVAPNQSEDGRAKNRRVELVEQ